MEKWLKDRAYHSWVDPRGLKKEEWEWAELNAYHSADVSTQILEDMNRLIAQAEYLRKKERGEIEENLFEKIYRGVTKK